MKIEIRFLGDLLCKLTRAILLVCHNAKVMKKPHSLYKEVVLYRKG